MVYAYDLWAQLPVKDLYDSQIMLASINAAKDMYEKGLQEMKDFKKEYGDFYSPIDKDMDWYTKNVTGRVLNVVNQLYNAGIDPLRSAEGRAAISRVINGIDTGRMARNKVSAENAQKYLQAKAVLEAAGKYDPDLEERYLGFNIKNWDSENGVWNRLSPAEAKSLKSLTESSFNNRTAHLLTEKDVKDFGLEYDPRGKYKGFTQNDLLDIANTIAPGLTGTMYADYFRDLAKQKVIASGIANPNDAQINKQLAEDIANTQQEYIIKPDEPDYTDWYQRQNIRLKEQANAIARQRALTRAAGSSNSNSNNGNQKPQFDYNDFLIGSTAANILGQTSWGARIGVGGVSDYNPGSVEPFMKSALQEIAEGIYDHNRFTTPLSVDQRRTGVGLNLNTIPSMTEQIHNSMRRNLLNGTDGNFDIGPYVGGRTYTGSPTTRPTDGLISLALYDSNLHKQNLTFLTRISMPYSADNFAEGMRRLRDSGNRNYILMNKATDKSRIYSADEVALSSAGVNRPGDLPMATLKTRQLRKNFETRFEDGKTMMIGDGYVVGRVGNDGSHHIFLRIRIVNKNTVGASASGNNAGVQNSTYDNLYNEGEYIYYDMGVDTQVSPDFDQTGIANMSPLITDQSFALDRAVLHNLGVGSTNVKSDESVPDIYSSYSYDDDDLLDLMYGE